MWKLRRHVKLSAVKEVLEAWECTVQNMFQTSKKRLKSLRLGIRLQINYQNQFCNRFLHHNFNWLLPFSSYLERQTFSHVCSSVKLASCLDKRPRFSKPADILSGQIRKFNAWAKHVKKLAVYGSSKSLSSCSSSSLTQNNRIEGLSGLFPFLKSKYILAVQIPWWLDIDDHDDSKCVDSLESESNRVNSHRVTVSTFTVSIFTVLTFTVLTFTVSPC